MDCITDPNVPSNLLYPQVWVSTFLISHVSPWIFSRPNMKRVIKKKIVAREHCSSHFGDWKPWHKEGEKHALCSRSRSAQCYRRCKCKCQRSYYQICVVWFVPCIFHVVSICMDVLHACPMEAEQKNFFHNWLSLKLSILHVLKIHKTAAIHMLLFKGPNDLRLSPCGWQRKRHDISHHWQKGVVEFLYKPLHQLWKRMK